MKRPAETHPIRFLLAGAAAGLALTGVDAVSALARPGSPPSWLSFFAGEAATWCALGTLGAVLAACGLGAIQALMKRAIPPSGGRGWQGRLAYPLIYAAPPTLLLSPGFAALFQGNWVSTTWLGLAGPSLAALACCLGLAVIAATAGRAWTEGRGRIPKGIILTAAGAALAGADHGFLPGLYLQLHDIVIEGRDSRCSQTKHACYDSQELALLAGDGHCDAHDFFTPGAITRDVCEHHP